MPTILDLVDVVMALIYTVLKLYVLFILYAHDLVDIALAWIYTC